MESKFDIRLFVFSSLELADEFLQIYEKCPDKIKKKLVYQNERVWILFRNEYVENDFHFTAATNDIARWCVIVGLVFG